MVNERPPTPVFIHVIRSSLPWPSPGLSTLTRRRTTWLLPAERSSSWSRRPATSCRPETSTLARTPTSTRQQRASQSRSRPPSFRKEIKSKREIPSLTYLGGRDFLDTEDFFCVAFLGWCEPLQQPSAAPGALRQVAWKRPGRHEDPHQGEQGAEKTAQWMCTYFCNWNIGQRSSK